MSYRKLQYVKAMGGGNDDGGGEEDTPMPIDNRIRGDWNKYVDWLRTKGLAGNEVLDKNGYGNQVLQQYIKENPTTSLTVDVVKPLQSEFIKYRQWALDRIKSGKAAFADGTNENNFMAQLSPNDAYAGSKTTSYKFPNEYLTIYDKPNNTTTTQNLGFATQK